MENTIKAKSATIATLTKRSESNKKQMIDWKIKFNDLKENLASTSVDALSEDIEHWKETAEEMRDSYEESIHSLTPQAIEKSWIKNLNKKGMIVPATVVMSCLTHTNTLWCLSILVTCGHMEWNTNTAKLILNWLANRTPPSCIRVNLLSMALAINTKIEVVKEIPCVRHIQVLCTVLYNVTQAVAGKTIAESTKIK